MRILRINGQNVDIDKKTAIGITLQAYDFKEPGKRKVNISNSFTIPLTSNNRNLFGFAENVQSADLSIYSEMSCDYWIDNEQLIEAAKVRVEEITNRIKLYVVSKNTFWEEIKNYKWRDFIIDFRDWLYNVEGEYIAGGGPLYNYFNGTFTEFINAVKDGSNLLIPFFVGNLFNYEPNGEGTGFLEDEETIYFDDDIRSYGGHVCTYAKTIFRFLEYKYGVDFLTSNTTDTSLLWNDTIAPNIYIQVRDISVKNNGSNQHCFEIISTNNFKPYEAYDKADKTMYDFVNSYLQLFNVIVDEEIISGTNTIKLHRFDDLETKAEVINFSGKIDFGEDNKNIKFKPKIADYKQINRIKYGVMYPDGEDQFEGAKVIECKNRNLDLENDLFTIDAYYANFIAATYGDNILNLSTEEAISTFCFMISDGNVSQLVNMKTGGVLGEHAIVIAQKAQLYGIEGEYLFVEKFAEYPKSYSIKKWLTITDITGFKAFKQYYIQELNGSFYINKISGFNPELSNNASTIELIRISNKTPFPIGEFEQDVWLDGLGNIFTDGLGNSFIY